MFQKGHEQAELDRGNGHDRAFRVGQLAFQRIEPPAVKDQVRLFLRRGRSAALGRAAQDRADPGDQFARLERFGHVIVRADFQPDDPVGRLAPRGQQDGRDGLRFSEVAAQRQPVLARHHDVEQDQVGRSVAQVHARLCRAGGLLHDKPLASEILGQGFAQGSFVIDEEQAGCLTLIHG